MLITAGVQRIHLCTPSNKAVDEIITRFSEKGFKGNVATNHQRNLVTDLLRVGSMEYEASPAIKQHSLDVRINRALKPALVKAEMRLEINQIVENGKDNEELRQFLERYDRKTLEDLEKNLNRGNMSHCYWIHSLKRC